MDKLSLILEISKENLENTSADSIQLRDLSPHFYKDKAITLIGVRRGGKSSVQKKMIQNLDQQESAFKSILYLNFEDDRLADFNSTTLGEILNQYMIQFPSPRYKYFFFDEIQNLENWEKLVRRLLDQKHKVCITGSSAKTLSKEIATSLRGRTFSYQVFPLSFLEWLHFNHKTALLKKINHDEYRIPDYYNLLKEFLSIGGFPELTFLPTKIHHQILRDYVDVMLFRDIIERNKFTQETLVREVYRLLASQSAQMFSINKLNNDLKSRGFKFSKDFTYEVISAFHDAYALFPVSLYSLSIKKQQTNLKKIYNIDNAIKNLMSPPSQLDLGRRFENLIFVDLLRSGHEVYYYLTEQSRIEVDFIAIKENQLRAIQVSWNATTQSEPLEQQCQQEVQRELKTKIEYIYPENYLSFVKRL